MKHHLINTEVQDVNGRVRVKVARGRWVSRGRYNFQRAYKRLLDVNERVFHINGNCADDTPRNLVAIRTNTTSYRLKHSRVVFRPTEPAKARPFRPQGVLVA